ncbi:hypothetical protein GI374_09815 [Paracoccus sp. S-4012]|uniref:hypothetical protein n=1 Tax=Paracoccus sp. S-4012 TaxID=2665648 RepID=UPI0012AF66E1|nr:hypothetical protein [Paracoccus sp. S-4012]MRX50736.1 hypothetical protein [Paracoccus sp. S-4012]
MHLSPLARRTLVGYLNHLINGGGHLVSRDELAALARADGSGAARIADAAAEAGRWCAQHSLPNIAVALIGAEHEGSAVMLPDAEVVDAMGGEAAVRAEQARLRDFDWQGWRDA